MKTRRLAICLGLTRVDPQGYGGWGGDCPGCDHDAREVACEVHRAGFDGLSVLVNEMVDDPFVRPTFLSAAELLDRDDLLLLFYSGHGGQQPDLDGDELDGRDETLCFFRGEVRDDAIASFLCLLRPGVRVLLATDSCNSGSPYRGMPHARSSPVEIKRTPKDFRGSLLHFGGCADGRSSYGDDQGGVWTNALLKTLRRARRPISYAEWFDRAAARMPRNQVPVMSTWGEGDFSSRIALT